MVSFRNKTRYKKSFLERKEAFNLFVRNVSLTHYIWIDAQEFVKRFYKNQYTTPHRTK